MDVSQAAAPPQLSPDGQWWWDGEQWVPAAEAAPARPAPTVVQDVLPSWGQPVAAAPASRTTRHDGLAIASLVLGLLWFLGLSSIAAVVCGHLSRSRAASSGRRPSWLALVGLVLGYLGIASLVLGVLAAVALPAFLSAKQSAEQADVAEAVGVPDAVEAQYGGSPFTPEQFGRTQADLEAHRRACSPTATGNQWSAAVTYAAIRYDTHFEETLLSWSFEASPGPSSPAQRAEMLRLDRKQLAAIEASPDLVPTAAGLVLAMRQYDDLLAVSLDPAAWDANAEQVHALGAARGAAAVDLRKVLGLGGGSCMVYRP